ncbi:DUF305 domain-containing protein [Streptomyces pratensis]|uniref:DUF305 domain-containing protein n=1 Tax=Streptomyces pratensis TaxID=1169025 RepID=UPI0030166F66
MTLALLFAGAAALGSSPGGAEAGAGARAAARTGADTGKAAGVPTARSADAGFARDMAVHHQQAVEMSFIVRDRTRDEDVRRLAYDIANTQANQRGMLLGWLDLWGLPKIAPGGERPMAWMAGAENHGDLTEHQAGGATDSAGARAQGHGHGPGQGHAGERADAGADGARMPGMASRPELERLDRLTGKRAEVFFLQLMTDHHRGGVAMAEACASRCAVPAEQRLARGMVEGQQSELGLMRDMLAARGASPRS